MDTPTGWEARSTTRSFPRSAPRRSRPIWYRRAWTDRKWRPPASARRCPSSRARPRRAARPSSNAWRLIAGSRSRSRAVRSSRRPLFHLALQPRLVRGFVFMDQDFILIAKWIVPVEPAGALDQHAIVVRAGRIEALLPAADAKARFPGLEVVDLPHHIVLPGLVSAHTHAATTLLRGLADERRERAASAILSREFVLDGTLLACAEMLAGGITCFSDAYFFPEASLEAARSMGVRSVHGILVMEAPTAYASDPADYLRKGLALRDLAREDAHASFCIAPRHAET